MDDEILWALEFITDDGDAYYKLFLNEEELANYIKDKAFIFSTVRISEVRAGDLAQARIYSTFVED